MPEHKRSERRGWAVAVAMTVALGTSPPSAAADQVPVPETYGDAMRWYQRAAEAGNPRAQFYLGLMAEAGVRGGFDPAVAVAWYRKAAEQGHAQAQMRLATMHRDGRGVARDLAEAAHWFARAADAGVPAAYYDLALMVERGWGVAHDPERAAELYRQAADAGVVDAWRQLSVLYAEGRGVERDLVEALTWLDMAAAFGGGSADAGSFRDLLVTQISDGEVAEARRRAQERLARLGTGRP